MDSRDEKNPNYGFQTGPPAYDQYQNFPQAPPNSVPIHVQPPNPSINYRNPNLMSTPGVPQVVTGW